MTKAEARCWNVRFSLTFLCTAFIFESFLSHSSLKTQIPHNTSSTYTCHNFQSQNCPISETSQVISSYLKSILHIKLSFYKEALQQDDYPIRKIQQKWQYFKYALTNKKIKVSWVKVVILTPWSWAHSILICIKTKITKVKSPLNKSTASYLNGCSPSPQLRM